MQLGTIKNYLELIIPSFWVIPIMLFLSVNLVINKSLIMSLNDFFPILILVLITSAYNSFNAVFDMKIDIINKRGRPLPSKRIKPDNALKFSIILYVIIIFLSLATLNMQFFLLVILNSIITIIYSLPPISMKNRFLFSNMIVALQYGLFPLLIAWSWYQNVIEFPVFFGIIAFILAFSTIFTKDFEDYTGDKIYNSKTLIVVLGEKKALYVTLASIISSYLLIDIFVFLRIFKLQMFYVSFLVIPFLIVFYQYIRRFETNYRKLLIVSIFLSIITVFSMAYIIAFC